MSCTERLACLAYIKRLTTQLLGKQPSIIVPFTIKNTLASVFDELLKAALESFRLSLANILDIIDAYSHIKRWQNLKVLPYNIITLQSQKNIFFNYKLCIGQYSTTCISHKPQSFKTPTSFLIEFGPRTKLASWREASPHNPIARLDSRVYPTKAECLLYSIKILQSVGTLGCRYPYLTLCGMVFSQPFPPLFTITCMQSFCYLHFISSKYHQ